MSAGQYDHIPPENLRLCLKVAENECNSLRLIVAWCGARLPPADRATCAKMVRDKICKDGNEEREQDLIELAAFCVRLADHMEKVIKQRHVGDLRPNWYAIADDMINRAREYEPPSREATLGELRNLKEFFVASESA